MSLNSLGYKVLELPAPDKEVLGSFQSLPPDHYCRNRFRRFSQYQIGFTNSKWELGLLPLRPHVQPRKFNNYVGGILRYFEPLIISPDTYVNIVAKTIPLVPDRLWQVDVHQWRTSCSPNSQVVSVPEGPHRDGHDYAAILVLRRDKILGGETRLYAENSREPFFRKIINDSEAIVFDDRRMLHFTTELKAEDQIGYRDIFVVTISTWGRRKYGDAFEKKSQDSLVSRVFFA